MSYLGIDNERSRANKCRRPALHNETRMAANYLSDDWGTPVVLRQCSFELNTQEVVFFCGVE